MLTIHIKTGNAAFSDGHYAAEVCRILRDVANDIEETRPFPGKHAIRDINGNTVGFWEENGKG